ALARATRTLDSGAAWETFVAMVGAQGGDRRAIEAPGAMPQAPMRVPVRAPPAGVIDAIDTFAMGELAVSIGRGPGAKEDEVDRRVGLRLRVRLGAAVREGDTLGELLLATEDPGAGTRVAACFVIGDRAPAVPPLVLERVD